ncbi:MAG: hypothetical protein Q8S73_33480 [Deltaproteobacteria bacterium]|nr:hypothetical protein [Myxococcales bacterium]MDP3219058.1 hypothetical protein [Deltaproteobacteria bacterium]
MTDSAIVDGPAPGLRVLQRDVSQWQWSPDGRWLAATDPVDLDGQTVLRVYDHEDGREALTIRGREVLALAWPSSEHLLVVRAADLGSRAVLHSVPDGGVLGTTSLPGLTRARARISLSATRHPDECAARALVTPGRWPGGLRENVRQRSAYALSLPDLAVVAAVEPDTWTALPRLPHVRPAVATLSPDGDLVAVWLGTPFSADMPRKGAGSLWMVPWSGGVPRKVCSSGDAVESVVFTDPSRLLLQSTFGLGTVRDRGDLALVDAARGMVLYDSRRDAEPDDSAGRLGAQATVDVHPDRERAVLAGRQPAGAKYTGSLQELDLGSGLTTSAAPVALPGKVELGMSAAYTGDGDSLAVLSGRAPRTALVTLWPSYADGALPGHPGWSVLLEGKKPREARLTRSPGPVGVTVSWRIDGKALRRGSLTPVAERLAWITRDALRELA